MVTRPLSEMKKLKAEDVAKALKAASARDSAEAGLQLARDAASFNLPVDDYLRLAIGREAESAGGLDGFEQTLYKLNLPVRNDFANGVHLQAASETFQTFPGTRALFPPVFDQIVRWASRQDQIENVTPLISNSRSIQGVELVSTVVSDDSAARDTFTVAEGANIPTRTIRTSEQTVKMYKHGSAIRTTYEFQRRASIDLLVPYANRVARELEISKLRVATKILINGDGVNAAATPINQSSYNTPTGFTAVDGRINWPHFLYWLMQRAKLGTPIDTVVMNWDAWFQWLMMFGAQEVSADNKTFGARAIENLNKVGVNLAQTPALAKLVFNITPVLSSSMTAGQLMGFSKGDTMEELVEAGANIAETERVITNQTVTLVKSEVTGYRLVYGDTRSIFVFDE